MQALTFAQSQQRAKQQRLERELSRFDPDLLFRKWLVVWYELVCRPRVSLDQG
jgi:hypothetical protein